MGHKIGNFAVHIRIKKTVTGASTATQLTTNGYECRSMIIVAHKDNTGVVAVSLDNGVSYDDASCYLDAKGLWILDVHNKNIDATSIWFYSSVATDKIIVTCFQV